MFVAHLIPHEAQALADVAKTSDNPAACEAHLLAINAKYWELIAAQEAEDKRHREAYDAIREAFRALEKDCPHPELTCEFIADPYSSYDTCNICGADGVRPG